MSNKRQENPSVRPWLYQRSRCCSGCFNSHSLYYS